MPAANRSKRIRILELDRDLAARLDPATRRRAIPELQAPVLALEPGDWDPPPSPPQSPHLGFLVLRGLMARQLEVSGACCIELLSSGDLLRPWQEDAASFVRVHWQVLARTHAALLTAEFTACLCRYPQLVEALVERTMQRSRSLAVHSAIDNVVGLEESLQLLFWHLAERWGKVERDGVIVPLRLTHQMLADLVGARRPSVTLALRELGRAGALTKLDGRGWRLTGSPPGPSAGRARSSAPAIPTPQSESLSAT